MSIADGSERDQDHSRRNAEQLRQAVLAHVFNDSSA
jgi:hypothetical protein